MPLAFPTKIRYAFASPRACHLSPLALFTIITYRSSKLYNIYLYVCVNFNSIYLLSNSKLLSLPCNVINKGPVKAVEEQNQRSMFSDSGNFKTLINHNEFQCKF